jgi:hypothetical protein
MSVNLNEFTSQQLQIALEAMYFRLLDCRMFVKSAREIYEESGVGDLVQFIEFQDIKTKINEIETLELFRDQILNAIVEVKSREIVNSN